MPPVIAQSLQDHAENEADANDSSSIILDLIRNGSVLAMIFGGVFPFIPQYLTIRRTGSAEGFSLYVCLTLLVANILRILFWFGKRFEFPLLIQSAIMIVVMMVLVHAAVNAISTKRKFADTPKHFRDLQLSSFWNWCDYRSYVECVVALTVLCSIATYSLTIIDETYIEAVGFLAVFIEACLGIPQFFRNCQKQSTAGMSVAMVAMWTCGDSFKTGYFHFRQAPVQFFFCGALQIVVDVAILMQIVVFRRNSPVSSVAAHSPVSVSDSPAWSTRDKPLSKSLV